jgi:hypothetical protein
VGKVCVGQRPTDWRRQTKRAWKRPMVGNSRACHILHGILLSLLDLVIGLGSMPALRFSEAMSGVYFTPQSVRMAFVTSPSRTACRHLRPDGHDLGISRHPEGPVCRHCHSSLLPSPLVSVARTRACSHTSRAGQTLQDPSFGESASGTEADMPWPATLAAMRMFICTETGSGRVAA